MFKMGLEKAEEPEIKLPTCTGSLKKQENSKKNLLLLYWLCQSFLLCGSQQTVGNSSRDANSIPPTCLLRNLYEAMVKKQQLELDMEQQTGSKSRKEYIKAEYCHPAYLTYMQSTSCEMLGWMKHKLQSRLLGETAITSKTQMIWPLWWKVKKSKEPLDESERGEWKSWLKTQHSEN